jgi:hypothetical protein
VRFDRLGLRGLSEAQSDDTIRLAAGEFGFQAGPRDAMVRSWSSVAKRRSSSSRCAGVTGTSWSAKLSDEREALSGRQAGDFIRG